MESVYLEAAKLNKKSLNKDFEQILAFTHEFHCYFFRQSLSQMLFRLLKIGEKENEYLLWISADFNEVDLAADFVEISIEHLSI